MSPSAASEGTSTTGMSFVVRMEGQARFDPALAAR